MYEIEMKVQGKAAFYAGGETKIVCDNADYELVLDLDAEWDSHETVTVLFALPACRGTVEVLCTGRRCKIPVVQVPGSLRIGVTAGEQLHTTRWMETTVIPSIRTAAGDTVAEVPPDITQQIIERLDELEKGGGSGGCDCNAIVGMVSGAMVSITDAAEAPLRNLRVLGRSTPVGVDGEISVHVLGKNMLTPFVVGVRVQSETGAQANNAKYASTGYIPVTFANGEAYHISGLSNKPSTMIAAYDADKVFLGRTASAKKTDYDLTAGTFTTIVSGKNILDAAYIRITTGFSSSETGDIGLVSELEAQMEVGSAATAYEPHMEKVLSVSTPGGLAAVPVSSGGNYVDAAGQRFVCDEVDFGRGVRIQRVGGGDVLAEPVEMPIPEDELDAYRALVLHKPNNTIYADGFAWVEVSYTADVKAYIEKILAEAKASGEFDGEPGKQGEKGEPGDDYVLTAQDKSDIAQMTVELLPKYNGEVENA